MFQGYRQRVTHQSGIYLQLGNPSSSILNDELLLHFCYINISLVMVHFTYINSVLLLSLVDLWMIVGH